MARTTCASTSAPVPTSSRRPSSGWARSPDMTISLRPLGDADLGTTRTGWESDPGAVAMAAFTRDDPADRDAFDAHYRRVSPRRPREPAARHRGGGAARRDDPRASRSRASARRATGSTRSAGGGASRRRRSPAFLDSGSRATALRAHGRPQPRLRRRAASGRLRAGRHRDLVGGGRRLGRWSSTSTGSTDTARLARLD